MKFGLTFVAAGMYLSTASGCTLIVVGQNATVDGQSTFVAHTDDAGGGAADVRLVRVPAADYPPESQRPVYNFHGGYPRLLSNDRGPIYRPNENQTLQQPMGYIPQVNHTYAYFDSDYGMMNEKQLAIGESTCSARTVGWPLDAGPFGHNLFGIAELSKVALERCTSARCAIQTMGDLAVEYGFFSEDSGHPESPGYGDAAETLGIADALGETWIFHILTGVGNASAIWAAQRVPATQVSVVANAFMIRKIDFRDTQNFMTSPRMKSIAETQGWYTPKTNDEGDDFDFTAVFGYDPPGPLYPLYAGRRVWRVYDVLAPSLALDPTVGILMSTPTYPFAITPDVPVTLDRVMALLRDYYQNTTYDLSRGLAAGPFQNPIRYDGSPKNVSGGWERPISMFRTMYSFVLQSTMMSKNENRSPVSGTIWYGQGTPAQTVFVPFSCVQNAVPHSYLLGKESGFNSESAWWAFKFINNWSSLRYHAIQEDVALLQHQLQAQAFEFHQSLTSAGNTPALNDGNDDLEKLTERYNVFAQHVVTQWWTLAWTLVAKYADGFITTGEDAADMLAPGYPKWWLESTSFSTWPGNSFHPPEPVKDSSLRSPGETNHRPSPESVPSIALHHQYFIYGVLCTTMVLVLGWSRHACFCRRQAGYSTF